MAQPHPQPQQRPPFAQQSQSFTNGPQQPNLRPQYNPQSPLGAPPSYSSPSPQPQYPPSYSSQAPPAKRARLSPDAQSPFPQPVGAPTPQAGSPVAGQTNGYPVQAASRPGMMAPPQQPHVNREELESNGNVLRDAPMTNFNNPPAPLTYPLSVPTPHTPLPQAQAPHVPNSTAPRPHVNGQPLGAAQPNISQEDRMARNQQRLDWEEARHAQHELWDPFLYGGTLNETIKRISHRSQLQEPQSGVLVNTQKNQPAPIVRVNGYEGASRIIDKGQSILDTRERAERLTEVVKLLSLSAKARMTGLVQAAARLAMERQQHSQGRIPDAWAAVAVPSEFPGGERVSSPAARAGIKRTHSQAIDDTESPSRLPKHAAVSKFAELAKQAARAEVERQQKRRKRNEALASKEKEAAKAQEDATLAAAVTENEKKSKKEKKAEARPTEQQQHAQTNEAARMAMSNIMGGKKKKYSWMAGGGTSGPASGVATPTRPATATSLLGSAAATPPRDKKSEASKGPQVGTFDEKAEPGIQARDLLVVLESDGKAPRSFVKGSSTVDAADPA